MTTAITREIERKIREALETKADLFQAIKEKGVTIANPELFSGYPQAVRSIQLSTNSGALSHKEVLQKVQEESPEDNGVEYTTSFTSTLI